MLPTTCATSASLNEPSKVGYRQTMSARSQSVGISSKAIGLPGKTFATLGVSPAGHLGPKPYCPSPKVTNIPLGEISTPVLWNICSAYQFVLKSITNSYNQDPAPCRQHCSTPLIIKILLMPLIVPYNPLLCHYFHYYLKWVYDNEMFTIGNTLNCSYGGLGEENSDLHFLRAIRG